MKNSKKYIRSYEFVRLTAKGLSKVTIIQKIPKKCIYSLFCALNDLKIGKKIFLGHFDISRKLLLTLSLATNFHKLDNFIVKFRNNFKNWYGNISQSICPTNPYNHLLNRKFDLIFAASLKFANIWIFLKLFNI